VQRPAWPGVFIPGRKLRFFNRLNMNPDTPLQLLGGLTAREFLRDYWQKKPLLVRQAFPDFESPIDPDELAGLALEEEVESSTASVRGSCAAARSPKTPSPSCQSVTGPCWYKLWTSSSRKWPSCWKTSASCQAGVSTM
jgi:hypothetical protein